ncbi:hypothetical protein HUB98_20985 [Paenibacillus barcinonensis]|uniref:Uncharacterized protein n=1 Tax=Paenibacillus barcinonensis TaxID=198119 RepID=A0A2V4W8W0_PAEBA|nr:hypothetical protein [Paenibacillus barcinonensis]PYE47585.1 hypothetical protein DFQ00_11234 [Paenibacillus barcinonensis]QKS58466.1 hypothetical protein HUB98_20985 [Paenibacillus barcinonensis]
MDKQSELTRKMLLNSNSRGDMHEVVPMDEAMEDAEFGEELNDDNMQGRSFWDNDGAGQQHEWNGRIETHAMFRRSYE